MPALPNAAGVVKTVIAGNLAGRAASVAMHWADGAGLPYLEADVVALTELLAVDLVNAFASLNSTDWTWTNVVGTDLTSDVGVVVDTVLSTAGTNGGPSLPLNVAWVVKELIARRYRGGHGHIFIPAIAKSYDIDEDQWPGASIAAFDALLAAAITSAESLVTSHGSSWSLGILSYFTGGAERDVPVFFDCTGTATQPRVCTRRRRLPKIAG